MPDDVANDRPQEEPKAKKGVGTLMSPATRNLIVATAIVVILLTVTAWSGTVRKEKAMKEVLVKDVAALAATFKYPLLEARSLRTSAGHERLQPMVVEIARAADYQSMILTDGEGNVLATTKGALSEEKIPSDELPKGGAVTSRSERGLSAAAPIRAGDSTLGYLFVETAF